MNILVACALIAIIIRALSLVIADMAMVASLAISEWRRR